MPCLGAKIIRQSLWLIYSKCYAWAALATVIGCLKPNAMLPTIDLKRENEQSRFTLRQILYCNYGKLLFYAGLKVGRLNYLWKCAAGMLWFAVRGR